MKAAAIKPAAAMAVPCSLTDEALLAALAVDAEDDDEAVTVALVPEEAESMGKAAPEPVTEATGTLEGVIATAPVVGAELSPTM